MTLNIDRIAKSMELLQRIPGLQFRKSIDGISPMLSKENAIELENAITADLETEVQRFKDEYLKAEQKKEKDAAKPPAAEKPAEPAPASTAPAGESRTPSK